MACSCGKGETQQPVFSATTPYFFRTILVKLVITQIPEKFERICGETLSKDVVVRLPCGSEWKMGSVKHDKKLWLQEGWTEFSKHYNLERACLLVFRYEGKSKFAAVIFDQSAVEVDYPYTSVQFHEPDIGDQEDQESKGTQTEESASVEILEDFSFSLENQSPLPSSSRLKRRKTSNSGDEMKGDGDKSTTQRQRKYDVLKMMKPLCPGEKDKALKMTTGFKSKNRFFKVVMQPSYVMSSRWKIPSHFARKYLKDKSGRVNLKVSSGKTWSVTFTFSVYGKNRTAKFYNGWKVFAQANNLDIGDVCVFVLTKGSKVSFEVTIFRVNEIARSPSIDTSSNSDSDDETCILGSPDLPTKQASGGISSLQECPTKEGIQRRGTLTQDDNPFFEVVMQPINTHSNSYLPVPLKFAKRYLNKDQCDVILEVPDGRFWSAECKIMNLNYKGLPKSAGLYGGWSVFALENNLDVGDLCIFELVTRTEKISFRVFIVRLADYAYHQLSSSGSDDDVDVEKTDS